MPDVLSQDQIDELLNNLSSGEAEINSEEEKENTVRKYDFRSPKKLSKEQIKTLTGIHENFARHLASYLSGVLRIVCEISVLSIEEQPYYEYNNSLPDSVLIGVIQAKPIEGDILVDISNTIAFTLIDRLLGGSGNGVVPDREFTEIEVSLMQRIFKQITIFTKESWPGLMNMETGLKQIETNARLIQSMAMDEIVVIVVMDVTIGEEKGTLTFCIPCINLESIIDQYNQNQYSSLRKTDPNLEKVVKETMISHVNNAPLEIKGLFGKTDLTLREVLNLQVGDVICFDGSVDKKIKLNICDKTWFYGIPGKKRNQKAVKISKIL